MTFLAVPVAPRFNPDYAGKVILTNKQGVATFNQFDGFNPDYAG